MTDGFFGALAALRARALPDLAEARRRRPGYRSHAIDPGAAENAEPLVDVRGVGVEGESYYHRVDGPPYYERAPGSIPELLLRRSVAQKLSRIDARLRAAGLRLHVFDAFRPRAVQAFFHDRWMPARLRAERPGISEDELRVEVERFWAAPTERADSPAPHETGGAVDLTIALARNGEALPMGSLFDDMHAVAATDHFETGGEASYTAAEARLNRRLLYWLMDGEGFANNPNEWWHFSWGDQMWARLTGRPAAVYGLARFPSS